MNIFPKEEPTNLKNNFIEIFSLKYPTVDKNYISVLNSNAQEIYTDDKDIYNYIAFILNRFDKKTEDAEKNVSENQKSETNIQSSNIQFNKEQYKVIMELFPDADPTFLFLKCREFHNQPEKLMRFINDTIENKKYPSLVEFHRKEKISVQKKQYTTEFSVEKYLNEIPEPYNYFYKSERIVPKYTQSDKLYIKHFFMHQFPNLYVGHINKELNKLNFKLTTVYDKLCKINKFRKMLTFHQKPLPPLNYIGENILMLRELAYLSHKKEIDNYLLIKKQEKTKALKLAIWNGILVTCECCYNDSVMPEDSKTCSQGHVFCKNCVIKSVEMAIGNNKTNFPCLKECNTEFSLHMLKDILKPNILSKLARRKMLEEVKSAEIEGLECCPFCDYAAILETDDKVFHCLNVDCMRDSCRLCRKSSHIPYECHENNEIELRTYVEDKLTDALSRTCWKCNVKFIKESGCNRMKCPCGAMMCYVCKKAISSYDHFSISSQDLDVKCPLNSNTDKLHLNNIKSTAKTVMQEIKDKNPTVQLKYNPAESFLELLE